MGVLKLVSMLQAAWAGKYKVNYSLQNKILHSFLLLKTLDDDLICDLSHICPSSHISVHTRLPVILSDWQKYFFFLMSGQYSQVRGRDHVCIFTPVCPCREIWSRRQHPVHEGRLLCAALCFQPVHERNCNYGTQPPPLTHANMHYN